MTYVIAFYERRIRWRAVWYEAATGSTAQAGDAKSYLSIKQAERRRRFLQKRSVGYVFRLEKR